MLSRVFTLAWCLLWFHFVSAYKKGDTVPLYYNKVFSLQNQLSYSYQSLSFICPPQHQSRKKSLLVFDQDFRGDRLVQSDYKVSGNNLRQRAVLTVYTLSAQLSRESRV